MSKPETPAAAVPSASPTASGRGAACPAATAYYDGACPLCRAEIAHYRKLDRAGAITFVDVSVPGAALGTGLDPAHAMARFHVRDRDGRLQSGAAAFVALWQQLPGWRWAARVAAIPGVVAVLELGYRAFLPVRPYMSRLARRVIWRTRA